MARYFYPNARSTTEGAKRIELSWLKKHNYLNGYGSGNLQWSLRGSSTGNIDIKVYTKDDPRIEFFYKLRKRGDTEWSEMDYSFSLSKVPCYYGGYKWFFVCGLYRDGITCGKRARVLYEVGNYFGCRKCANLSYKSCNESKRFRSGVFRILTKNWDAEDYRATLKRTQYRGKPTRKFKKYLKLGYFSDKEMDDAERAMEKGQFY